MRGWAGERPPRKSDALCCCLRLIAVQRGSAAYYFDMNGEPRIILDPAILTGKPVIKGTRLSVEFIVGLLAQGWSEPDILRNYPGITHEDVLACLRYAHERLTSERVYPMSA